METKQTALQTLINWGDKKMLEEQMNKLSFAEVIDKATELLQMEKHQIMNAWVHGFADAYDWPSKKTAEEYYNETYNDL